MRRAFTLIELLVVIAIIAILAAILFPVFAQAKVAAKGAASLSNMKQNITAWIMYAGDYDDRAVPMANTVPGPLNFNNQPYSPWGWLTNPYRKEQMVTQDPLVSPNRPNAAEGNLPLQYFYPYRPQYGYAATVWSPYTTISNNTGFEPKSLTEAAHPADTVAFTARKNRDSLDWYWTSMYISWQAQGVAAPYCNSSGMTGTNPTGHCAVVMRWGIGGNGGLNPYPTDVEGGRTGGNALRKTMQSLVAFADGHARFMPPARLARGTNWHWNSLPSQIQLTNVNEYMWDLD
jgi:prepilin-type N-terminal cleavage/methylation domain-containing protein